jgi:hypothetical protein
MSNGDIEGLEDYIQYSKDFPLSSDPKENFNVCLIGIADREKREKIRQMGVEMQARNPDLFNRFFSGRKSQILQAVDELDETIEEMENPNRYGCPHCTELFGREDKMKEHVFLKH